MLWLILTILAAGAGVGLFVFGTGPARLLGPIVTGAAWLILTIFLSLHTVGQREVGLVQSFSGTIGSHYKSAGVVFAAPWNHVKTENVGLQKELFDFSGSNTAVSKDQQPITATIAVNYQVEPANVVRLWKTVGPSWKTVLLDGRIPQAFKETTAQFKSAEITLQRPLLRKITLERLRRELAPYDIRVVDVFVSNIGYSQTYENAIEAKLQQQQAALTAQAKVAQSTAEANQAAAVADGEKRAAIARAEGDAKSIELKGRALRNNPEVIRYEAIQRLSAQAKVIFCTTNNCPSIVGSLAGK